MKKLFLLLLFSFSLLTSNAQYSVLHYFNDTSGAYPLGNLTLVGHTFFGMTLGGGANNHGCIFSVDTNGSGFTDVLDFNGTNGYQPYASLLLAGNKLYGTTNGGGGHNFGTIFSIDTMGGGYIDIYDFDDTLAGGPLGSLIISGNVLYGTTSVGGPWNEGSVFSIHTGGSGFKVLYNFLRYPFDINGPEGDLTLIGKTLFGTASYGGSGNGGVFSIDTNGTNYRVLHSFNGTDGGGPTSSFVLSGKVLFGTTYGGGIHDSGVVFSMDTDGSNFKDLFYFRGDSNGHIPYGSLILSGKRLIGMTEYGGKYEDGLIYSIDTDGGNYKHLVSFNDTNGAKPMGSLTLIGPSLYGMTANGGLYHRGQYGVIFRADTSLNDTTRYYTNSSQWSVVSGQVQVYPNPSNGIFTIAIVGAKNFSPAIIEVYNVFGQRVETQCIASLQKPAQFNIDLREKPNGVYFYRIVDENGGNIGTGKLIIEH